MTEPKKPRANYSMEFKLAMVEKSLQPGVSVALLARNNGINDNLLFKWRRRYRHLVDAPVDEGAGTPVIIEGNIVPVVVERTPEAIRQPHPEHAGDACSRTEEEAPMISLPAGSRIWLVAGVPTCATASTAWRRAYRVCSMTIRSAGTCSSSEGVAAI